MIKKKKNMQRSAKVLLLLTRRSLGNNAPAKPSCLSPCCKACLAPNKTETTYFSFQNAMQRFYAAHDSSPVNHTNKNTNNKQPKNVCHSS